jgi:hypothetical protein
MIKSFMTVTVLLFFCSFGLLADQPKCDKKDCAQFCVGLKVDGKINEKFHPSMCIKYARYVWEGTKGRMPGGKVEPPEYMEVDDLLRKACSFRSEIKGNKNHMDSQELGKELEISDMACVPENWSALLNN